LNGEIGESKFKTYDELKTKFLRVTGGSAEASSFTAESIATPTAPVAIAKEADVPWDSGNDASSSADDDGDDTMSYFAKLAKS
jgi:hypothetical protein